MNLKDVIKTLEIAKAEVEWNYPMDYAVAIDEAIEAVDKQIPKRPEIEGEYYICPVCGVYQETSEGNPPYCINCGQAIDWGCRGMTELKKCPFCGGEANIESYDPYDGYQGDCTVWRVKCIECKSIIQRRTKEEAIEAWNRRAE